MQLQTIDRTCLFSPMLSRSWWLHLSLLTLWREVITSRAGSEALQLSKQVLCGLFLVQVPRGGE